MTITLSTFTQQEKKQPLASGVLGNLEFRILRGGDIFVEFEAHTAVIRLKGGEKCFRQGVKCMQKSWEQKWTNKARGVWRVWWGWLTDQLNAHGVCAHLWIISVFFHLKMTERCSGLITSNVLPLAFLIYFLKNESSLTTLSMLCMYEYTVYWGNNSTRGKGFYKCYSTVHFYLMNEI